MDLTGTIKDNMFAIMKGESCGYNQLTYPLISAHPLALRELDKSHPWGAVLFLWLWHRFPLLKADQHRLRSPSLP